MATRERKFDICAVGTKNACKLAAVESVIEEFSATDACFPSGGVTVKACQVSSGISEQPMSMAETLNGAKNRAKAAFDIVRAGSIAGSADPGVSIVSLGIESGLFEIGESRYYDVCICSAYDGTDYTQGMSCAFEVPQEIMKFVLNEGMDLSQASNAAGVTSNQDLGQAEGLIGILSRGRIDRKQYTEQAVAMSLMHVQNRALYGR